MLNFENVEFLSCCISKLLNSENVELIAMIDNMMVLNGLNSGPRVVGVGLMIVFSILVFALFAKGSRAQE